MGRLTFQIERIKAIIADDANYQADSLKIGAIWDICDRTASYKRGKDTSGKDFIEVLPPSQALTLESVREEALAKHKSAVLEEIVFVCNAYANEGNRSGKEYVYDTVDELTARIRALQHAPAPRQRVSKENPICEHGRNAWADDCGMCELAGTEWAAPGQHAPARVAEGEITRKYAGYCSAEVEFIMNEIEHVYKGDGSTSRDWGMMRNLAYWVKLGRDKASVSESPAKEQLGEQNAAPQAGQVPWTAPSQEGRAAGPAAAAPDVAAIYRRGFEDGIRARSAHDY